MLCPTMSTVVQHLSASIYKFKAECVSLVIMYDYFYFFTNYYAYFNDFTTFVFILKLFD